MKTFVPAEIWLLQLPAFLVHVCTVSESPEELWLLWDDFEGKVLSCFQHRFQGDLRMLNNTRVMTAPRECVSTHTLCLCAHILVFHLKLFARVLRDEETMVNLHSMHRHTLYLFCQCFSFHGYFNLMLSCQHVLSYHSISTV